MDNGRSRSQPLCHSHVDLPCSLQGAFDFEQVSRPCLHLRPWFLTPDWVMIQALLFPTAPTGLGLGLWSGSGSNSPRPLRISYVLKKEAVCGWEGRGMAAQCGWVEDKSTAKTQGQRSRLHQRAPWEEKKKHKEEKMGNIAGGPVAKNLCSQSKGPGFHSWSGNY